MFLDIFKLVLDSDDRTVGGGSASALAGAMAAGMASMVAKLSAEKPVNFTVEQYEEIIRELEECKEALLKGSEQDNEAYLGIKNAYALPKETDEEIEVRKQAIRDAAYVAACVPRDNGMRDKRVYELVCALEGNSNPACTSDLLSAKYLSASGVRGCVLNIEANLPLIKNEEREKELTQSMEELVQSVSFSWT